MNWDFDHIIICFTVYEESIYFRAYSCVTCYHIVVGDRSAIEHHTTCHKSSNESSLPSDIDIDDIIGKTMIPLSARNSRSVFGFSCPCCSTNICSINSLRLHLVSIHGILAQYQQMTFSSHKGLIINIKQYYII
jgi:hypothetical protein